MSAVTMKDVEAHFGFLFTLLTETKRAYKCQIELLKLTIDFLRKMLSEFNELTNSDVDSILGLITSCENDVNNLSSLFTSTYAECNEQIEELNSEKKKIFSKNPKSKITDPTMDNVFTAKVVNLQFRMKSWGENLLFTSSELFQKIMETPQFNDFLLNKYWRQHCHQVEKELMKILNRFTKYLDQEDLNVDLDTQELDKQIFMEEKLNYQLDQPFYEEDTSFLTSDDVDNDEVNEIQLEPKNQKRVNASQNEIIHRNDDISSRQQLNSLVSSINSVKQETTELQNQLSTKLLKKDDQSNDSQMVFLKQQISRLSNENLGFKKTLLENNHKTCLHANKLLYAFKYLSDCVRKILDNNDVLTLKKKQQFLTKEFADDCLKMTGVVKASILVLKEMYLSSVDSSTKLNEK